MNSGAIATLLCLAILSFVAFKIYRRVRRSGETIDIAELRHSVATLESDHPELYRTEFGSQLDSWTAEYGNQVPAKEFEKFQRHANEQAAKYGQQRQQTIARLAAEGKTLKLAEIRRHFEKLRAQDQGADRDERSKQLTLLVESLEANYGSSIPIDEAFRIVDRLESGLGDEAALHWSAQPGLHERRLLIRLNNKFFPLERRRISKDELAWAKQTDAEILALFEQADAVIMSQLDRVESLSTVAALEFLKDFCELGLRGRGIGAVADDRVRQLNAASETLVRAIGESVNGQMRQIVDEAWAKIKNSNQPYQRRAFTDAFEIEGADRLPSLLSCDIDDLRFLFQELPPECTNLLASMRTTTEDLKSFAVQLMHDSSEARMKLQQQPGKLALLEISL
jgi:hypothetical protein